MRCERVQARLDDYLDGSLTPAAKRHVDRHLAGCLTCSHQLIAIRKLVRAARGLASGVPPARDLWPAIRADLDGVRPIPSELDGTSRSEPFRWLQLAAAILTLLVVSVPLSVWWVGRRPLDQASVPAAVETFDSEMVSDRAELARTENHVLLARQDLLAAIERRRKVSDDHTLLVLDNSMRLLDRAIGELRMALEADPENRCLHLLLARRYQQERRLLQTVSRM